MKTKNIMFTFFMLCITIVTFGQIDSATAQQIGTLISGAVQSVPEVQKNPFGFLIGIAITNLVAFVWHKIHVRKRYTHNKTVQAEYEKKISKMP